MTRLLALLVALLPFQFAADVSHGDPARSTAEKEAKKTQTVSEYIRGQVLKMDAGAWVVKDEEGREMTLKITGATQADPNVKVGDKIRADMTPDGKVTSIKKSMDK